MGEHARCHPTAWTRRWTSFGRGFPVIQIDSHIFRPAEFIELSIHNLRDALLLGTLLVVLVLVAFLFQWRAALISLAAIPLSLMAAALVLYAAGRHDQHDGAGGVRDLGRGGRRRRDHRHREHRPPAAADPGGGRQASASSVVLEASLEVRRAIVYATLIIVLAVMPVFFITSVWPARSSSRW